MIEVESLSKTYGSGDARVTAVDGISFAVPRGQIFGYLGRNGSGKTTTVRMLTTLTKPTSGGAIVAGADIKADPGSVRAQIGVTMQDAALDPQMSGRQHLNFIAGLLGFGKPAMNQRVDELLDLFGLQDAADRKSGEYSGGMQRRLDIATALLGKPPVLFLDEPTTGLDPQSRNALWEEIRNLKDKGTTIFLTTQYIEEANQLADNLAIIDSGSIIAEGSPADLKRQHGRKQISFLTVVGETFESGSVKTERGRTIIELPGDASDTAVLDVVNGLHQSLGSQLRGLEVHDADLEDVFLRLTGRAINIGAKTQ